MGNVLVLNTCRGASGICLPAPKSNCSHKAAEGAVELLLCLTTSFMGGGQSDTHPPMSYRQFTVVHTTSGDPSRLNNSYLNELCV